MKSILKKLAKGHTVPEAMIEKALYQICDDVHADCDEACPIFEVNDGPVDEDGCGRGCTCFKDGRKMRKFLRDHS